MNTTQHLQERKTDTASRYAFRSTEKVALQEIGPRFTLKLRTLRKGIPAVKHFGEEPKPLTFDLDAGKGEQDDEEAPTLDEEKSKEDQDNASTKVVPPKQDEFLWAWKVGIVFIHITLHTDLSCSRNWRRQDAHSFCRFRYYVLLLHLVPYVSASHIHHLHTAANSQRWLKYQGRCPNYMIYKTKAGKKTVGR